MKLDFLKKVSKKTYIKLAIYLSIVIGGFALDRISKVLVANNLKLGVSHICDKCNTFLSNKKHP